MTQWTYAASGTQRIFLPQILDTNGTWEVTSVSIDNGTALILDLEGPDGAIYQIIPPYQTRQFTTQAWTGFQVRADQANIATVQATDVLNIYATDAAGQPPSYSSYGPASWGGGAVPNSLVPVLGNQGFFAWQVQQIINLLTGVMTGQPVKIANSLELNGPSGALFLDDTDGIGGDTASTMLTAGQWLFQSSVAGASILSLNESGGATPAATVATRIGAIVGANAQRLLNVVPVQGAAGLTASGTGAVLNGTLTFPVGQLPNSTTLAWFDVNWTSAAVGDRITFLDATANFNGGSFVTQVAGQEIDGALAVAQATTGSRVVRYTITSAGAWSFGIVPHAYAQPT